MRGRNNPPPEEIAAELPSFRKAGPLPFPGKLVALHASPMPGAKPPPRRRYGWLKLPAATPTPK